MGNYESIFKVGFALLSIGLLASLVSLAAMQISEPIKWDSTCFESDIKEFHGLDNNVSAECETIQTAGEITISCCLR